MNDKNKNKHNANYGGINWQKRLSCALLLTLGFLFIKNNSMRASGTPLILLQAFGSQQSTGRKIADNTERGVTLQLAEYLKNYLEDNGIPSLIINPAGKAQRDTIDLLSKINQLKSAVAIQLSASSRPQPKAECSVFYRCYNPLTDQIKRPQVALSLIPLEEVYLGAFHQSKTLAKGLVKNLQHDAQALLTVQEAHGIPLTPVKGIRHPSIQIEIGVNKESPFPVIGEQLAQAIIKLVQQQPIS